MALRKGKCPNCGMEFDVETNTEVDHCYACEKDFNVPEEIDVAWFSEEGQKYL